jgi:hypothetical protein
MITTHISTGSQSVLDLCGLLLRTGPCLDVRPSVLDVTAGRSFDSLGVGLFRISLVFVLTVYQSLSCWEVLMHAAVGLMRSPSHATMQS